MKKQFHASTNIVKITNILETNSRMNNFYEKLEAEYRNILSKYIVQQAIDKAIEFVVQNKIIVRIKKERSSKLGDFRPGKIKQSKITINYNLTKDQFLITLLHEFAHFQVWNKTGNMHNPHGDKWKYEFALLIYEYIDIECFNPQLTELLRSVFAISEKKVVFRKEKLHNYLITNASTEWDYVKDLEPESEFMLKNGRQFRMIEKRRTRYLCKDLENNKRYLVHGLAEIIKTE
jgi:hypothetical protein